MLTSVLRYGPHEDGNIHNQIKTVSYTHLRAHETPEHLVCRLLLEKKLKNKNQKFTPRRKDILMNNFYMWLLPLRFSNPSCNAISSCNFGIELLRCKKRRRKITWFINKIYFIQPISSSLPTSFLLNKWFYMLISY